MPNWQSYLTDDEKARLAEIDAGRAKLKRERDTLMNRCKQRKHRAK